MDDAGVRRHDLEVLERALAPAQERVALLVALELDRVVLGEGLRGAEVVHLHRVVDHELGGGQRIDHRRLAAELDDGVAHRGEVDDRGHAREVLEHHAGRRERDLAVGLGVRVPVRERGDVVGRDVRAVLVPEQVLEQDLERVRQGVDGAFDGVKAVDLVGLRADFEGLTSAEAVCHWGLEG